MNKFYLKEFIGLTLEDAIKLANSNGYDKTRVVYKDGNNFIVTRDYLTNRVNFYIEKGIVIRCNIG